MKKLIILILVQICLLAGMVFVSFAKDVPFKSKKTYAITNVNVIPMDRERVLRNRTVVIENGIITEIRNDGRYPKRAVEIDGTGKYLTPGFVDMHTHLFSDYEFPDSLAEDELKIMLANGVTTTRLMIGVPEHLELREKSAKGEILAPTIYAASPQFAGRKFGDIYNGYVVTNEEQARDSVRKAKAAGYDFIKLTFWISRPVYDAIIDEAKKQDIRVIGHVDAQVGIERVFETGQQIEHLDGFFEGLIPRDSNFKFSTSGVNVWNPKAWDSIDVLDETKISGLAKQAVKANPYSVPTLTFLKVAFGIGQVDEEIISRPDYRFLPKKIRDEMAGPRNAFWSGNRTPEAGRRLRYVELRDKIVKALHDAGGKIMAGSDAPEWFLLYGYTLHRELESLSQAGLSNYTVLESTTRNPAEFFGALDKFGTVEKGKRADLVLLDSNPLVNISNTKKIAGVMVKGNWIPKSEIDEMLGKIAPKFQTAFDKKESAKVEQFGKDIFSGEVFRGSFAPDGKTFYFFKKIKPRTEDYRIFTSHFIDERWTEPKIVDLGGEHSDLYPTISKDGKRLVFSSYRPAPNDNSEKPNAHLWYVDKESDGSWGKANFLSKVNKLGHYHSWVEFGWDGDIYFRQTKPDWKDTKSLITRWNGREFTEPFELNEVESWKKRFPKVNIKGISPGPNKDIILFDVPNTNPQTGRNAADIWFAVKQNGKWTEPKSFGEEINKEGFETHPFFSPDGEYLYFVRDFRTFQRISLKAAIGSVVEK